MKRTSVANPAYAVWAPFDNATTAFSGEAEGVVSKIAVNVPVCAAMAVFCHGPPEVAVTQVPFTVRVTLAVWVKLPLVPVMVSG